MAAALWFAVLLSVSVVYGSSAICNSVTWGSYIAPYYDANIVTNTIAFDNAVGRTSQIWHMYINWADGGQTDFSKWGDFKTFYNKMRTYTSFNVSRHTPLITWQPWGSPYLVGTANYPFANIISGQYDTYIDSFFKVIGGLDASTVYIRLAHEFDGNWYPWGAGVNGNTPTLFINMWKHVVGRLRQSGAANVKMVWCPNHANDNGVYFENYYPGDDYVDWVCLDAYSSDSTKYSFNDTIFTSAAPLYPYTRLTKLTNKPMMIAEFGAKGSAGYAQWFADMSKALSTLPQIQAMVFFDSGDYKMDTTVASTTAGVTVALGNGCGGIFGGGNNPIDGGGDLKGNFASVQEPLMMAVMALVMMTCLIM